MPELPEVETIRQDLCRHILHLTIRDVKIRDSRVLAQGSQNQFTRRCQGKTVQAISRRGKVLIIELSPQGYLVVQPKMTGHLIYRSQTRRPIDPDTKILFQLSNGSSLNYNDQRLFGRIYLVDEIEEVDFLRRVGSEPLEKNFTPQWLKGILEHRPGPIKSLLMNQNIIAGIGNIYASEILFLSRIRPQRPARTLTLSEIEALHRATLEVLKEAIALRGTSMRNYRDVSGRKGNYLNRIKVYGREDEECFQCRSPIQRIVQAGRSTFYCRKCQR